MCTLTLRRRVRGMKHTRLPSRKPGRMGRPGRARAGAIDRGNAFRRSKFPPEEPSSACKQQGTWPRSRGQARPRGLPPSAGARQRWERPIRFAWEQLGRGSPAGPGQPRSPEQRRTKRNGGHRGAERSSAALGAAGNLWLRARERREPSRTGPRGEARAPPRTWRSVRRISRSAALDAIALGLALRTWTPPPGGERGRVRPGPALRAAHRGRGQRGAQPGRRAVGRGRGPPLIGSARPSPAAALPARHCPLPRCVLGCRRCWWCCWGRRGCRTIWLSPCRKRAAALRLLRHVMLGGAGSLRAPTNRAGSPAPCSFGVGGSCPVPSPQRVPVGCPVLRSGRPRAGLGLSRSSAAGGCRCRGLGA